MKMRKKIAALLAAAMIASVMPMTAFAASTNRITQIVKVADDGATADPKLSIELKDGLAKDKTFYLKLENAKWNKDEVAETTSVGVGVTATFTVEPVDGSDTELAVTANEAFDEKDVIVIGLNTKDIKGEATVEVEPWDTTVTAGKYVFATSSSKKAIATVGDAPSFYTGTNDLAKITLEESALGAFASAKKDENIEITLDNDDFEFTGNYTAKAGKGFRDVDLAAALDFSNADNDDAQRFVIKMVTPALFKDLQRGTIEIELEVKSTTKRPTLGDLEAEVGGDLVEAKDVKVATIAEYGVELKSEKEYEFVAGKEEKVEFHLNEIVDDSMVGGRVTEFTLTEGVYFKEVKIVDGSADAKDTAKTPITLLHDGKDDTVNGFSVKLPVDAKEIDKFKFEAKIEITAAFEGDVELKAEGRSIGEELEVKLAEVEAPVKVTVEPMKVKPGFKEQVGGKIVIEETDKARLMQGKKIIISLDGEDGMSLEDADVEVTKGDLRKGDVDVKANAKDGTIEISVKRRSKEASTIEITNVKVKLDRTVPQGYYDVNVGGTAISELADGRIYYKKADGAKEDETYGNDNIVGKQFIIVGDPITGVKSEVKFVIGSNKFLVDGVEKEMDAAAYIKDGRTMVPLRYLATALGIDGEAIKFNAGTVTIFGGDGKVIQVAVNSKDLVINGMTIPMVAAAEIIDGRTYVPVTEIGGVFGVAGSWDAATQTATFK